MSYKLEYLPAARKDMLEIVRYISRDIGNPYAAERLAVAKIEKGEATREMPYICPTCIPLRPLAHEYRKAIVKHFLMFYRVDEEGKLVSVARVIYSKRDHEHTDILNGERNVSDKNSWRHDGRICDRSITKTYSFLSVVALALLSKGARVGFSGENI